MKRKLEAYGLSDIGLVRPNNEDVWISLPRYHFFALADGMGGHKAGEVAAQKTIDFLTKSIKEIIHPQKKANIPTKDLIYHLRSAIENVNHLVHTEGLANDHLRGMGTTLCCLYLYDESVIYAHVGDSRIYRFRDNELKQLTQDHSLLTEYKQGFFKNIITRAIGTSRTVEPEIASVTVQENDIFFMSTDGLTDCVTLDEMETILKTRHSLRKKAKLFIKLAKKKGSHDNITLLLIRVKPSEIYLSR